MPSDFTPLHSEVLVFIGAGATAALGMPSTDAQTAVFRALSKVYAEKPGGTGASRGRRIAETLAGYFHNGGDLAKVTDFLLLLDGTEKDNLDVSDTDIRRAKEIYGAGRDGRLYARRILELRREYDWNALRKVLAVCPQNEADDGLIRDVYSIIDKKLLAGQSLKVRPDASSSEGEVLPPARLRGARNFLTLFINMLFASAWYDITNGGKAEEFARYKKFCNTFDRMMQQEGRRFFRGGTPVHDRAFYLFSTAFVSFNFEMVFPWIFMNSHYELNHAVTYIGDRPLKLWLDYGAEHRGRKRDASGTVVPTAEFTESVASRENEDGHVGSELNRAGKFYFAHGSSNWRECPICGRMSFFHGNNRWSYTSKSLIPPFPIPLFEADSNFDLTQREQVWHQQELKSDALQCMHCGEETHASDAPMIMQTMYKSTPTSFLEEIQRNVKVGLEKARHIVLLGYRLPPDDTIWYQAFAEAVRSRLDTDNAAYCSVAVGYRGGNCWLYGDDLARYVERHRKDGGAASYGVPAIESAWAIFGRKNVRAYTGGIPQVFGDGSETAVRDLLYPQRAEWSGTRLDGLAGGQPVPR